jgi:hypothetical protein
MIRKGNLGIFGRRIFVKGGWEVLTGERLALRLKAGWSQVAF